MEMMGFESVKNRVVKVVNCKPITATIGRKTYRYKSTFEFHWACYLELLKRQGHIKEWQYEPAHYSFRDFGYQNKPYEYTPDFIIRENDGKYIYVECKGYLETYDISRIVRCKKHYNVTFDLVMQRLPKRSGKGSQLLARIKTKVRRVIDGGEIIKNLKCVSRLVGAVIE